MATPTTTDPKVDLDALIKNAEDILAEVIKEESETLAKAKDESSPESPEGSADGDPSAGGAPAPDASASAPAEGSTPAPDASAAPAPDASASPAPEAPPAEGAPAAPGAPADPAADAGAVDPAALKAEYAKLDDAGLEMHYMAAKEAVYERLQAKGGSPAAGAGAPAAPAGAGAPAPAPAFKNEKPQGASLAKSEEQKEIETLKAGLNKAMRAIEILSTPMRKSLTGLDYQPKPGAEKSLRKAEQMTKAEVTQVLTAKAADAKLSKKDRDLINEWCFGTVDTKEIEHLLSEK